MKIVGVSTLLYIMNKKYQMKGIKCNMCQLISMSNFSRYACHFLMTLQTNFAFIWVEPFSQWNGSSAYREWGLLKAAKKTTEKLTILDCLSKNYNTALSKHKKWATEHTVEKVSVRQYFLNINVVTNVILGFWLRFSYLNKTHNHQCSDLYFLNLLFYFHPDH